MEGQYINPKSARQKTNIKYRHNFMYDMQIHEFGNCFNEVTSNLLVSMRSLSPCDNFSWFDIPKLLRLYEMYPNDFDENDKRRFWVN